MRLFRNRNKKTVAELEDYYTTRQSNGMAWFMAFLSLVVTIAVIAGLFFGGRWLYRTFIDDGTENDTTTSEQTPATVTLGSEDSQDTGLDINVDTDEVSDQESAILGGEVSTGGVVSDEAASTERSNEEAGEVAGSRTGDSELPDTGAGEILVLVPMLTVAIGYYISRKSQLNQV